MVQLATLLIGGAWAAFLFVRFDARDKEIAHQKAELEIRTLKAAPVRFDQDISVSSYRASRSKDSDKFHVVYRYAITNTSSQKIKIAMLVVHAFSLPPQSLGAHDVHEISPIEVSNNSPWRRVVSKAYLAYDEELPNGVVESKEGFTIVPTNGGATGDMEPGEVHFDSLSAIVRNRNSDFIGFSVDAFVRFSDNTEKWITGNQFANLIPGEYSGSPNTSKPPTTK